MSNPMDDVGANVRAEMGRQRINMSELARRTRIPRATLYGQINTGNITVNNLVLIAAALEVAPEALLP